MGLYLSMGQECPYITGRESSSIFVDPDLEVDAVLYTQLARSGFRRSGSLFYRPHCGTCTSCRPIRVPVDSFTMSRSQERTWRRNQDLHVRVLPPGFNDAHFQLYLRYQHGQHPESRMNDPDPERYLSFLGHPAMKNDIWFVEFRETDRLLAVAVVDHLKDSLSAVYTFYDPQEKRRALGIHAVLWQIDKARDLGLEWVYLGYWVLECRKMTYKALFRPAEVLDAGSWKLLHAPRPE